MIFRDTPLPGAYVLEPERIEDQRGFFARIWCKNELRARGLSCELAQSNVGFSRRRGTLRGLHFQRPPHAEVKIVRCTRGSVFDVIVDLRAGSSTQGRWEAVEITMENRRLVYVPAGFAHGFLTLCDSTEVAYQMTGNYAPAHARGIRWDDPSIGVTWPMAPTVISTRDRSYPRS